MIDRFAAILTGPYTHLDHLGVLSCILEIPLFVSDEATYEKGCTFYPKIPIYYKDPNALSPCFMAEHFDVLFNSGKFFALELSALFKSVYRKNMRFVYCSHGNSDKGHSGKEHPIQDVYLVYGKQMGDLLTQNGAAQSMRQMIFTGNYRKAFYQRHQAFYDAQVDDLLDKRSFSKKKTILYTPSWNDGENLSSFCISIERVLSQLSRTYNVVVKLHPLLEEFHPAHTYAMRSRCARISGVYFLDDYPVIYPLLNKVDIYLGDYSSIGYDFLCFDKPLYFIGAGKDERLPLFSCGMQLGGVDDVDLFIARTEDQNKEEKRTMRESLYRDAFGMEDDLLALKKKLTLFR